MNTSEDRDRHSESPPHDGWKRSSDSPRRVAITFTVTTTVLWAMLITLVGFISDSRIDIVSPDTGLKPCPQDVQGMNSGNRLQARTVNPPLGGQPEKPIVTLEGAGIRSSQLLLH